MIASPSAAPRLPTEKDDAQNLVKIEITGTNQEGDIATKGSAEVILPGK